MLPGETATQLVFRTATRTTRSLVWTETENVWQCGPIRVLLWQRDSGKWVWQVFLDGKVISRVCGYSTAADAKSAAGRHKVVVKLMEEQGQ